MRSTLQHIENLFPTVSPGDLQSLFEYVRLGYIHSGYNQAEQIVEICIAGELDAMDSMPSADAPPSPARLGPGVALIIARNASRM